MNLVPSLYMKEMEHPSHTILGYVDQQYCNVDNDGKYNIVTITYAYGIYRHYILSQYTDERIVICNMLKPLFGIRALNTVSIMINGRRYIGYEIDCVNYTLVKDVTLTDNDINDLRKIHVFRFIVGATFNESKIICRYRQGYKELLPFGEVRFADQSHFINDTIMSRRFKDVDLYEFVRAYMPMLYDESFILNIENVIKSIDRTMLPMLNNIRENMYTVIS